LGSFTVPFLYGSNKVNVQNSYLNVIIVSAALRGADSHLQDSIQIRPGYFTGGKSIPLRR
jgi:hypothetical protein